MALYDPNNYEAMGPQITARPGTKRHAQQCVARKTFFVIKEANERARAARLQDQIDVVTMLMLAVTPSAGRA